MDRETPGSSSTVRMAVRAAPSGVGAVMRAPGQPDPGSPDAGRSCAGWS
jgi:hypothetical protein